MLIRIAEKPNDPAADQDDDVVKAPGSAQKPDGTNAPYGVNSDGVGDQNHSPCRLAKGVHCRFL